MSVLDDVSPMAVGAVFIVGQIISTLWFTVIFGDQWAHEYGAPNRHVHTKAVPKSAYGIQALCTATMSFSLALLQNWLDVEETDEALKLGAFIAVAFVISNIVPGQMFLQRGRVAALTSGCQSVMVVAMSAVINLVNSQ